MGLGHTPGRTPEEIKLLKCLLMGCYPIPRTRRVAAPAAMKPQRKQPRAYLWVGASRGIHKIL